MVTYSSVWVMLMYLVLTVALSILVNHNRGSSDDFSTGGRQFGGVTAGVSILATYVSAMTFIGMPGWVYQAGMQAMAVHLNYPFVIFCAVVFFVPVFYRLRLTSIYEYLELRFGVIARTINALVFLIVQCISAGVILYAISLILVRVLPISIEQAIIYLILFTVAYTFFGGISTVIWTDMLQSVVLLIGSAALFGVLISDISHISITPQLIEKFRVINLSSELDNDTSLLAGLVAVSFLHLSVYGTNQLIIQRTLATRDLKSARTAMMVCGYGSFFVYLFFSILGVLLFVFYQGESFDNSNNVILDFVFNHTNPIIIGLIISALTAAAMSTLDSTFNSMATVMTFDFYQRFIKQDATPHHYEKTARWLSLLAAICVIIPALLSISNESVLKTIASLTSLFVGIRLGSFLLGLFCRYANEQGVIWASVVSTIAIVLCRFTEMAWPWYAPIGTLVFLMVGIIISRYRGQLTAEQQAFVVHQATLWQRPRSGQYGLIIFGVLTLALCSYLPELVLMMWQH
ncbi:MAG: sodium:solute symporter family transporter [Shewanella sp.]